MMTTPKNRDVAIAMSPEIARDVFVGQQLHDETGKPYTVVRVDRGQNVMEVRPMDGDID